MSEREHPTIPQIVQALITLEDRHAQELREQEERHMRLLTRKEQTLKGLDRTLDRRDAEVDFLKGVIGDLCYRIERAQQQLRRDNQMCVYSEPLDIMNLLGRETDAVKVIQQAREKHANARRKAEERAKKAVGNAIEASAAQAVVDACAVEGCGHPEGRHVNENPEGGGQDYCIECSGPGEFHSFTPQS